MKDSIDVMVLDDEPIVGERLKEFLGKHGMDVEVFTESDTALRRLKEKTFDVIITDLKMRGKTGLDLLLYVKQAQLPSQVIMITGYGSFEDARDAEAVGVIGYLTKPFQMSEILKLVKKGAKRARRSREADYGTRHEGQNSDTHTR